MCRYNNLTINNGDNRAVKTDHKQVFMRRAIYRLTERGLLFLGAFAKLRKAIITFVTSVRPSVCPHRRNPLPMDGFSRNLIFAYFPKKSVEKIQVSLKSDKNNGYFTSRPTHIYDNISLNSS